MMLGACSLAVNDTPRTTPPGKFKLGINAVNYVLAGTGGFPLPMLGLSGRYGISEDTDLGFRIFGPGFGMEMKKAFNDQSAIAIGANLSSFGALFYDIYGTYIYGFNPTGSTLYAYFKPHLQGYTTDVTTEDTTYSWAGNGFVLQAGFGFHGNPEKVIQPSIELGVIYPLIENSKPAFLLSLGVNFMMGD